MPTAANLRPELARHLLRRLQGFTEGFRQNLAVIGVPGSGKTFQLQQLVSTSPPHLLPIYCPLSRESSRTMLLRLLKTILFAGLSETPQRSWLEMMGSSDPSSLRHVFRQAQGQLPVTVQAASSIEGLMARRLYGEAFNRVLDLVPTMTTERGTASVLILDEFLFLEALGGGHAFHELGKRVMTWPSTLFVLASSSPYHARVILRERLQLLFGQFELLTLETVDDAAAVVWVQQELRGLRNHQLLSAFLIRWLGTYPWYLGIVLKRLREVAVLTKTTSMTEPVFLQAAWELLGARDGTLHQWCRSRTEILMQGRAGMRAMDVLVQIALGARTATEISRSVGRAGVSDALQMLVEHDLAQRNGMCWVVTDPMLRCWLATTSSDHRVEGSLAAGDVRERFNHYLRGLWNEWGRRQELSFSEQVATLFSHFDDETVSVDSKTGRLPKFSTIRTAQSYGKPPTQADYLVAEAEGRRWCVTVQQGPIDESAITQFEAFCRGQAPKPSRKVVITTSRMDEQARLVAKAANMWVWEPQEVQRLMALYGHL